VVWGKSKERINSSKLQMTNEKTGTQELPIKDSSTKLSSSINFANSIQGPDDGMSKIPPKS
jgi:hypothetical protein